MMVQSRVRLEQGIDPAIGDEFYNNAPSAPSLLGFAPLCHKGATRSDWSLSLSPLSFGTLGKISISEFFYGVARSCEFVELCLGLRPSDPVSIKNTLWLMDLTIAFSIPLCFQSAHVDVMLYH